VGDYWKNNSLKKWFAGKDTPFCETNLSTWNPIDGTEHWEWSTNRVFYRGKSNELKRVSVNEPFSENNKKGQWFG